MHVYSLQWIVFFYGVDRIKWVYILIAVVVLLTLQMFMICFISLIYPSFLCPVLIEKVWNPWFGRDIHPTHLGSAYSFSFTLFGFSKAVTVLQLQVDGLRYTWIKWLAQVQRRTGHVKVLYSLEVCGPQGWETICFNHQPPILNPDALRPQDSGSLLNFDESLNALVTGEMLQSVVADEVIETQNKQISNICSLWSVANCIWKRKYKKNLRNRFEETPISTRNWSLKRACATATKNHYMAEKSQRLRDCIFKECCQDIRLLLTIINDRL